MKQISKYHEEHGTKDEKDEFNKQFQELLKNLKKEKLIDTSINMTLHTFRAGTVTILTNNNISDTRIMNRTGHTSVSGLDPYKMQNANNILEETCLLIGDEKGAGLYNHETKKRKFTVENPTANGLQNYTIPIMDLGTFILQYTKLKKNN